MCEHNNRFFFEDANDYIVFSKCSLLVNLIFRSSLTTIAIKGRESPHDEKMKILKHIYGFCFYKLGIAEASHDFNLR